MYLNRLSKEQKELFLDMCVLISKVDNDFVKEEKIIIEQLCDEMNIAPRYETKKTIEELVREFSVCSSVKEKRIAVIELLGIVMADKTIAKEEEELMNYILDAFSIKRSELKDAFALVIELYEVYEKFARFLDR